MAITAGEKGDTFRVSATFLDANGNGADPTAVSFSIQVPSGAVTTYVYGTDVQLVRDSTGVYHVDWTSALPGTHDTAMLGTGTVQRTCRQLFLVNPTPF